MADIIIPAGSNAAYINNEINNANPGDSLIFSPGTYNLGGSINLNKFINIVGSGFLSNNASTIFENDNTIYHFQINTSGLESNLLQIKNIRLEGGQGFDFESDSRFLNIENVIYDEASSYDNPTVYDSPIGIHTQGSGSFSNTNWVNCHFYTSGMPIYVKRDKAYGVSVSENMFIKCTFNGGDKILFESLSESFFSGCEFRNYVGGDSVFELNLKWDDYHNIIFDDCVIYAPILTDTQPYNGFALTVRARADKDPTKEYDLTPASLDGFGFRGIIKSSHRGVIFGSELNGDLGTADIQETIKNINLSGAQIYVAQGEFAVYDYRADQHVESNNYINCRGVYWDDSSGPSGGLNDPHSTAVADGFGGIITSLRGDSIVFDPFSFESSSQKIQIRRGVQNNVEEADSLPGELLFAIDHGLLYISDGLSKHLIGRVDQGTIGERRAPGIKGTTYFAVDDGESGTLYLDTGTSWSKVSTDDLTWRKPAIDWQDSPPLGPSNGDKYIIKVGMGDWAGHDNELATWNGSEWEFLSPEANWAILIKGTPPNSDYGLTYSELEGTWVQFTGTGQIVAGAALSKEANTLNVNVDDTSIKVNISDKLFVNLIDGGSF